MRTCNPALLKASALLSPIASRGALVAATFCPSKSTSCAIADTTPTQTTKQKQSRATSWRKFRRKFQCCVQGQEGHGQNDWVQSCLSMHRDPICQIDQFANHGNETERDKPKIPPTRHITIMQTPDGHRDFWDKQHQYHNDQGHKRPRHTRPKIGVPSQSKAQRGKSQQHQYVKQQKIPILRTRSATFECCIFRA